MLQSSGPDKRGYTSIGREKVRDQIVMNESFGYGNPEDNERPNSWPTEELLPGFRCFMEDFFQVQISHGNVHFCTWKSDNPEMQDCARLIHHMLNCLDLALDLNTKDSFGQYHASSLFNTSLIHYPAVPVGQLSSGKLTRNPAHSDFGTLTLLFQDEVGGLEVADMSSTSNAASATVERSGRFIHADPEVGTIMVNVGYLLMRWTNGRWRNTVHRVSEPPHWKEQSLQGSNIDDTRNRGGDGLETIPERYSIAYFSSPDPATVIEALSCCCTDQAPKKSINAGEYLRKKTAAAYTQGVPV